MCIIVLACMCACVTLFVCVRACICDFLHVSVSNWVGGCMRNHVGFLLGTMDTTVRLNAIGCVLIYYYYAL